MGIHGFAKVAASLQNQQCRYELYSDSNKLLAELLNDILPTNKHLIFREMLESESVLHQLSFAVEQTFTIIILNESVECFFALVEKGFKGQYISIIFSIMARELRGTKILSVLIERDEFPDKENILDFMIQEVRRSWFIFPQDERVQSYINKLNEFKNQLSPREQEEMVQLKKGAEQYILKNREQLMQERQNNMKILKQIQQIQQIEQNHDRNQLQNQMQNQRQEQRDQHNDINDNDLKRKNNDRMEY
ncbi:MAG: hypothetical protein Terrestrivirus5_64 [Terrestrivirus sp.]|uniref:Uncharacterized protein n=1 Tax=Terrestrivirus sp. TaxID=2487775 RepID=A0A3G4ZN07_9VIRU|nr:MAG: hypothetical protein Terrestrivirus5_64 [Terrestrivirus sp.]